MSWSQLWTILWLRWRLTRNQWSRHGTVTATISVIVTTLLVAIGAAGGIGGFLLGALGKVGASPVAMLGLWDVLVGAFLLFWLMRGFFLSGMEVLRGRHISPRLSTYLTMVTFKLRMR